MFLQLENLLHELGGNANEVVAESRSPHSASSVSASFQANRPSLMMKTTTGVQSHTSPQYVLQQMQAMAEMQAVILAASKSQSSDKRVPLRDEASKIADHHRQQHAAPAEQPATRVQSPLLALQQQQEQALAELRSMLMHRTSQQQHQDRDRDHQQHHQQHHQQEIQHQNLPHLSQESTMKPAPSPARALQQQQQQLQQQQQDALAELRAVLTQAPRDSSSSAILNAPLAVPLPVEAPFDAQPSSTTATLSQHAVDGPHVPQQHLQRAPSDDENSDSDFDQFLRVLDSS
jgi:hypothetical protein